MGQGFVIYMMGKYFLISILVGVLFYSCKNPTQYNLDNPNDPASSSYIPDSPTNLRAKISSDSIFVALFWDDNSEGETGFLLQKKLTTDSLFKDLITLEKNSISYEDTLSNKLVGRITYRIKSLSDNHDSDFISIDVVSIHNLSISVSGEGEVIQEVIPMKTTDYEYGTLIRLEAIAAEGWQFVGWSGDTSSVNSTLEVLVDRPKELQANFEITSYPLTVNVIGEGEVIQEVIPMKTTDYEYGTLVRLEAIAAEGWQFVGWSGDTESYESIIQLFIESSMYINVLFINDNDENGFQLADNGVTILCPDVDVGSIGIVNGILYTKRGVDEINVENAEYTCTSDITDLSFLFSGARDFNQDLSGWDVSGVRNMSYMFRSAESFNQELSAWDVSNVTNMKNMFESARNFNGSLNNWVLNANVNLDQMFTNSGFNQDVSSWDISQVTDLSFLFSGARDFNQDLSGWDVSGVRNMSYMFRSAESFNQDLSAWDVSNVTNMKNMFENARNFNGDLSGWCVINILNKPSNFDFGSSLQQEHLPIWGTCPSE